MTTNPSPLTILSWWSFDPSIVLGVALGAAIYVAGLRELDRRGKRARLVSPWHIASYAGGLIAVVLALESPIDELSARLFSAHMLQHMLLLVVAPPLLLLGRPIPVLLLGLPHELARWVARAHARHGWFYGLTRALTSPWAAWLLFNGCTLAWHLPALYQAALEHPGIHLMEHIIFLVTGLLFWWVIIEPAPGPPRLAYGWRLLYDAAAMFPGTALGAVFLFASTPVYTFYAGAGRLWGISLLDDQALAGNIMWLVGDAAMLIAAIPLFVRMMERFEQREQTRFDAEIATADLGFSYLKESRESEAAARG